MREWCRLQIEVADDAVPIGLRGGRVGMRGGIDLLRHGFWIVIDTDRQLVRSGSQPTGQLITLCRGDVV